MTAALLALLALLSVWLGPQLLFAAPDSRPPAQSSSDPLVLSFYYTWFDENTWTYDKLSDLPAQQYASRDRAVMGRHIEQAQRAGIDAFLVAWYGPGGGPNQTETNLAALLDEAAARGFRIGILFETDSPFFGGAGDVTAALQHIQNTHANHSAFLRADGRPVVFFWRPAVYGVETWRTIRAQSDPNYSNIWIAEGVDTSYLAVFDGHHLYSNAWSPPANLTATNQKFANQVAAASESFGVNKLWVATVMPGYNDVRIRPEHGFARDRAGGEYYNQSWQAAIATTPNWIVINSFNEWPEGTYIEPSAAFGDQYINATATWSGQFKANGGAAVQAAVPPPVVAAAAAPAPAPTPFPETDVPTAFVEVALLNLRAGPGTEHDIVGQMPQGTALPITGSHPDLPDWWQVEYASNSGENTTGWVYAPLTHAAGPLETVAPAALAASSSSTATLSTLPAPHPLPGAAQDSLRPHLSR